MNIKYHILKTACPQSLLEQHGYPSSKNNKSQGSSWFVFDGNKETDLEPAFDAYLISDEEAPSYMPVTKNMTDSQAVAIITTTGPDESQGWLSDG